MRKLRNHVRQQFIGYLALFVALSGSAYAAATIGPSDIKRDAVRGRHIKAGAVTRPKLANGAVNGAKVADKSLTGTDIALGKLGTVPSAKNAALLGGLGASAFQRRVLGGCGTGEAIKAIGENGTVSCQGASAAMLAGTNTITGANLPFQGEITTTGGDLLVFLSGSASRATAGDLSVRLWVEVQATKVAAATARAYTDAAITHKTLSAYDGIFSLPAGTYNYGLDMGQDTTADANDHFDFMILELPH